MKNYWHFSLFLLLAFGCEKKEKLTFETVHFSNEDCQDCPEVNIVLPSAVDQRKISEVINTALKEEVIALLSFNEEEEISDIPTAILSFNDGFEEVNELFPDEIIPWEATIKAEKVFENKELLSIGLSAYIFTGGAHGYGSTRFLNFDKKDVEELDSKAIFKNLEKFQHFAELKFRIQENIPEDSSINSTGFMFELDAFYLPENIGFTEEGLKLLYNPYEVASYADGTIELTLPYKEVKEYLAIRL